MHLSEICAGAAHTSSRVNAQSTSNEQPHPYGLMIECDGVLVDIHKDCHRVAFNQAFEVRSMSSEALPVLCQASLLVATTPSAISQLKLAMSTIALLLWHVKNR